MKIRVAAIEATGGPFVFRDVEIDEPRPDEVLVRVVATGICHTDTHVRNQGYETPLPIVLGHEGAGIVEKVGADVQAVKAGDHVVMSYPSCGRCRQCFAGHPAYCVHNLRLSFGAARLDGTNAYHDGVHGHFFGQSSFATYSLATERNVVKVPDDVPLELLGPLGCGFQTGAGAVLNVLDVGVGTSLVVLGTGGVGLAAIMAAHTVGAGPIIAVDISDERLARARELGATHGINGKSEDVTTRVRAITGSGADFVIDLTGQPKMLALAVDSLAPLGTAALIGASATGTQAPIDMGTLLNGRAVRGIIQGDAIPQSFIPKLVELYKAGRFPFDQLVQFYAFDDIERAFEDTKQGKTVKPVLRIGSA
jgi:aryl-alcohol dehydrogenase